MASAPAPISKFAPPRTFEHTPPPASDSSAHMSRPHHPHQPVHSQQLHSASHQHPTYRYPPYPPSAHFHPPHPPQPSGIVVSSPNMHPTAATPDNANDSEKGGAISRLKRSFQLRARAPLSRTWEKASFAEECQSAPASMVDVSRVGGLGGVAGVSGVVGDGYAGPRTSVHEGGREMGDVEMRRSADGRDTHAALFSPTGRPTSLYASPAAIRAFKPLPPISPVDGSAGPHGPTQGGRTPRHAATPLRA